MERNNEVDRKRILRFARAFVALEYSSEGIIPNELQLAYVTIANQLATKISNSGNTVYKLVDDKSGVVTTIPVGRSSRTVVVTFKNRTLCYK